MARISGESLDGHARQRRESVPTQLFADMVKFLATFHPTLVVIGTLADVFGGDEIKRAHARQFVEGVGGNMLGHLIVR